MRILGKFFIAVHTMNSCSRGNIISLAGIDLHAMYFVQSFYVEQDSVKEFQEWVLADETQEMFDQIEEETGMSYVETYFPILGFGDYTCEVWWEIPDWGTLDDVREIEVAQEYAQQIVNFADESSPMNSRMLRTASDVLVTEPE